MSFILYYPTKAAPTKTVTLPSPEPGNTERTINAHALGRTRGGERRVYDKGIARKEATYNFKYLTATQKADIETFMGASYADGLNNEFQIEDHHATLWHAWFNVADLEFTNPGEVTPPATDPYYDVTLNLEISAS
jgi:hypothetical protein